MDSLKVGLGNFPRKAFKKRMLALMKKKDAPAALRNVLCKKQSSLSSDK